MTRKCTTRASQALSAAQGRGAREAAALRMLRAEKELQAAQRAILQDGQDDGNRERLRLARAEYAAADEEGLRLLEAEAN